MTKAIRGFYPITQNEEIAPGIFKLCVEAPEIAAMATAGQFVNVYLPGGAMLLPRPISLADATDSAITLAYAVVGKGTETLVSFAAGEKIEVMGPLGVGFFDYPGSLTDSGVTNPAFAEPYNTAMANRVLLVGGGAGIPPLYYAVRKLCGALRGRVKIEACLGFREYPWYIKEFERVCDAVRVCSETEGVAAFHGNVIDLLGASYPLARDQKTEGQSASVLALACGPKPMLQAISSWCAERGIPLRLSLEERMGCGYGACAGCIVKTRPLGDQHKPQNGPADSGAEGIIRKKVCAHGPVFWADEVIW